MRLRDPKTTALIFHSGKKFQKKKIMFLINKEKLSALGPKMKMRHK